MNQNPRIALIADRETLPEYTNSNTENAQLLSFLKEKGLDITPEVWDNEKLNWSDYNILALKTPWDYCLRIKEFHSWLDKLDRINAFLLNPIQIIRWNSDKIYFKDMEKEGIKLVPTLWLDQGNDFDVENIFEHFKTPKIIVKPRVSGSAKHTYALTKEEALQKREYIKGLIQEENFMTQPFLQEIQTQGEWSLIYFNGKYSHSVLKTAKSDDFRVQDNFGGNAHNLEAPSYLLEAAQNIVDKFAKGCLYARVDGLDINQEFVLMELEIIEPQLFLTENKNAMEMYYQGLLEIIEKAS